MGSIITPEAWASRRIEESGSPTAWATTISSSEAPAPKRRARAQRPPMVRAATSRITGPSGPSRASAWTGPSRSPSASAAAVMVRKTAAWTSGGWRDGVT